MYIFSFGVIIPMFLFLTDYAHLNITEYIDLKIGDMLFKKGNNIKAIDRYQKALLQNSTNSETFAPVIVFI